MVIFSAGFSGSETAFFSLDRGLLNKIRGRDPQRAAALEKLRKRPRHLLATLLTGNELVNTGVAVLSTALFYSLFGHYLNSYRLSLAAVAVGAFTLILCGEITPKAFAIRYPEQALRFAYPLVTAASRLFYPLTALLQWLVDICLRRLFGERRASEERMDEAVFCSLLEVGEREGIIQESEKELIHRLFEFDDLVVSDVMTPRTEIFMLPDTLGWSELLTQVSAKKFSRVPIYGRSRDEVLGILHAKDLLKSLLKGRGGETGEFPRELLSQPLFVPAGKKVVELFRTFKERQLHLAVVVDEYGGVLGLVTMEDLLEELFGEIRDEYDQQESLLQKLGPDHYLVSGREALDSFCQLLSAERPRISSRTVNGLLLVLFGHLPREGEEAAFGAWTLLVKKVSGTRVTQVEVRRANEGADHGR